MPARAHSHSLGEHAPTHGTMWLCSRTPPQTKPCLFLVLVFLLVSFLHWGAMPRQWPRTAAPWRCSCHFARRATLADTGSAHTQASHGLTRTLHPTLFCHRHHDLGPLATPAGSTVEQLVLGTRIAQHQAESLPCHPDRTQHGVTTIDDRPRS